MSDEEEYEVESIVQAKVTKKRKKLCWQFLWKGYTPDDDTWEPIDNFEGSEELIDSFFLRANCGGRDYRNLDSFQAGEEFVPTGPPRKRKPRKSSPPSTTPAKPPTPPTSPGKRPRSPSPQPASTSRPTKRSREAADKTTPASKAPSTRSSGVKFRNYAPEEKKERSPSPPPRKKKKARRDPSPEIIPDSDEEVTSMVIADKPAEQPEVSPSAIAAIREKATRNLHRSSEAEVKMYQKKKMEKEQAADATAQNGTPLKDKEPGKGSPEKPSQSRQAILPSHRARAANPLVKMVDDPQLAGLEGAISAKARVLSRPKESTTPATTSTSSARPKPGPGRSSAGLLQKNKSSLLTFDKGGPKTVKGRHVKPSQQNGEEQQSRDSIDSMQVEDNPFLVADLAEEPASPSPPQGPELLELAGLDPTTAEALPDFEDVQPEAVVEPVDLPAQTVSAPPKFQSSSMWATSKPQPSGSNQSSFIVKNMLFPNTSNVSAAWKSTTIFDPLARGLDSPSVSKSSALSSFLLPLSDKNRLPINFSDFAVPAGSTLDTISKSSGGGAPGKFYSANQSPALLDALRTGGSCAKVATTAGAPQSELEEFNRFAARLHEGELFIAAAGTDILAFCSSKNESLAHRLNIPSHLLREENVLVSKVEISDYSAYADAAIHGAES
ncbi:hypothetical protein BDN72DRAFT_227683 [Pluteus cervinus]|uniref:Uncharacterized protein n=1 Tax=Pluteus cervinus TaxID=181527 RepID=A0ACD3BEN8_9AGAR|nr:hypothetical protein BDN72DRAFT_227683 [Pluteus cervinus]